MPDGSLNPRRGPERRPSRNVLGDTLEACSLAPLTGFYRNGCCDTGPEDRGSHTVCARVTAEFLIFSQDAGNDLSTPRPSSLLCDMRAYSLPMSWCVASTAHACDAR
jgi:uncharacterized protein (DUF2237 family)